MKTFTYKMRAECAHDVAEFLKIVPNHSLTVARTGTFGDCEATFTSDLAIPAIIKLMRQIPDAHVMIETIELEKNYTGERK